MKRGGGREYALCSIGVWLVDWDTYNLLASYEAASYEAELRENYAASFGGYTYYV